MIRQYTYKFRLYPNKEQMSFINEQLGYNRFVYNFFLERSESLYKNYGVKDGYKQYSNNLILPNLKKGFPFLKNAMSQSLQQSLKHLESAYRNFFHGRAEYPNFKKKYGVNGLSIPQGFEIDGNGIYMPKLKTPLRVKFHRKVNETVKSITITKTKTGKYYVSMLVEKEFKLLPKNGVVAGIDVGIKDYATITSGTSYGDKTTVKIANPKYLVKAQKQLVKLQRQLDRKVHPRKNGDKTRISNNYREFKKSVAKQYEKVSNQRKDFLHKLSSRTVNDSQVIVLEDLNIKGMVKNRHLSKSISDVSWSKFVDMLKYKYEWYGRQILKVNRFYPSSKACSTPGCGYIHKDLKLSERFWVCPECGALHDRDVNASINLFIEGLNLILKVGGESAEFTPAEYAPAGIQSTGYSRHTMKQEAHAS